MILDALSGVTGVPTDFDKVYTGVEGGTAETKSYPKGTRALQLPDARIASRFLDAFGRPDRQAACACERQQDSTVGQALMLNNGAILNDKLRSADSRVSAWLKDGVSDAGAIDRLMRLALGRGPTADELKKSAAILAGTDKTPAGRREALEDLFWAVLTGREFLFNH